MRSSSILVAITSNFPSTLCPQTMGCLLPINIDNIFPISHRRTVTGDSERYSCPTITPPPISTERTIFGTDGCTVYGYPSAGGVLIKEAADLVDMLFLSLPRSHASPRSPSAADEDRFCNLMRRTGAKLWPSTQDWIEAQIGMRDVTEEEEKVLVFGWPADGVGVWVLRFASARQVPEDYGRMGFAMDMEERIQMMREYGAVFVEDVMQVEELRHG